MHSRCFIFTLSSMALAATSPVFADVQVNTETITNVNATTNCDGSNGLCGLVSSASPVTLTNKGQIDLEQSGSGQVYGLYTVLRGNGEEATLQNFGSIGVRTSGGNSHGLYAWLQNGDDNALLYNFATIRSEAAGINSAHGLTVVGTTGSTTAATLVNSGTAIVTAQGTGSSYGLFSVIRGNNSTVNLVNLGTIISTAQGGGTAYGVRGELYDNGDVGYLSNTGTILAQSTTSGGKAYGIAVDLEDANTNVFIHNTGTIQAIGPTAHQLFVDTFSGGGGTAHLATWRMDVRDYASVSDSQKPFAVTGGATLNFGNGAGQGTHLILTPANRNFVAGIPYPVADMVNQSNGGLVTGAIGSVDTPLPFLRAHLSGDHYSNQTVALTVNAQDSDGQTEATGQIANLQAMARRVGAILAASGSDSHHSGVNSGEGASPFLLQVRPYYAHQTRRGTAAFATDATGVVVLGDYTTDDGHSFGFHAGFEHATLQAKSNTLKMNSMLGLVGVQGRYTVNNSLYLRGQISGMVAHNSTMLTTKDEVDTTNSTDIGYGLYGAIHSGYSIALDTDNTLTPELGLAALWNHTPTMTVHYQNNSGLNQSYAAVDYTGLYAQANLRWTSRIDVGNLILRPLVMGGIRQTLNDGKIGSTLTFANSQYHSYVNDEKTVGVAQVGLSLPLSNATDLALTYNGDYGRNTTNHMGYLNLKMQF